MSRMFNCYNPFLWSGLYFLFCDCDIFSLQSWEKFWEIKSPLKKLGWILRTRRGWDSKFRSTSSSSQPSWGHLDLYVLTVLMPCNLGVTGYTGLTLWSLKTSGGFEPALLQDTIMWPHVIVIPSQRHLESIRRLFFFPPAFTICLRLP